MAGAGNVNFSGNIGGGTGTISINKYGTGTLILAGANTYADGTLLNAGLLAINNATALGTGTFTIGGGTIDNTSGSAITLTNNNPVNINAAFTYGGTNNLNLGTGAVLLPAQQTFTINGSGTLTLGGNISGTGGIQFAGAGNIALLGTNTFSGIVGMAGGLTVSINSVTAFGIGTGGNYIAIQGGSTLLYNGTGAETLGTGRQIYWNTGTANVNVANASANLTLDVSNTQAQSGYRNNPFVKQGLGTLTLLYSTGNEDGYFSTFTINSGTMAFNASTASAVISLESTVTGLAGTSINVLGPGTVRNSNLTANWTNNLASMNIAGGGTFDIRGNNTIVDALTGSGSVIDSFYQATSGIKGDILTVGVNNGSGTFSGVISGTGTTVGSAGQVELTKIGTGTQTLSGLNTYAGPTTIKGGTLLLDLSTNHTGVLSSSSALVLSGGTLNVMGGATTSSQTMGTLTLNGGSIIVSNTGGATTLTLAGLARTAGATLNVDLSSGIGTNTLAFTSTTGFSGATAGSLIGWATVKDGTATGFATLSALNPGNLIRFTGPTTVLTTTNSIATTGNIAFTTNPLADGTYTGGTLALAQTTPPNATDSLAINAATTGVLDLGAGTMTFTSGGLLMTGANNYTIQNGQLGASGAALFLNQTGAGTLTIASTISSGAGTLTVGGGGVVALTGANAYTGGTNLGIATLNINADAALGGTSSTLTFTGAGILQAGANNISLVSTRGITLNSGVIGTIDTQANTMTIAGIIGGSGALAKTGSGTLTLTGVNTYSGGTSVAVGTLNLGNGTTNPTIGSGIYSINSGAMLRVQFNTGGVTGAPTFSTVTGGGTLALATGKNIDFAWGTPALPANFTGTIQIEGGRFQPNGPSGLGNASSIVVLSSGQTGNSFGGQLFLGSFTGILTQNLTLAGTGYGEGGYESAIRLDGRSISGNIALSASATIGSNAASTLSGVISGGSSAALTFGTGSQASTIILRGANTYTGNTILTNGTLNLGIAQRPRPPAHWVEARAACRPAPSLLAAVRCNTPASIRPIIPANSARCGQPGLQR